MDEHAVLRIEYDFVTKTGVVALPEDTDDAEIEQDDIVDYFEAASEGKVERVNILKGETPHAALVREGQHWVMHHDPSGI